ncbi:MAG TPA: hypothetical protein VHP33_27930 [Polyangiaceae bacterium]|nr:hypothetical protein [Polyangiaceae bacterium]
MTNRRVPMVRGVVSALALSVFSLPRIAAAEITLVEKDGWTVYMNGRAQAFLNYNRGDGYPKNAVIDGNGNGPELKGGGLQPNETYHEFPENASATETGKIEELRIRTGFVGNVLGFGIKKKLNDTTEVLGYTAVTTYIDSTERRKYLEVRPDWRECYLKITGNWGSLLAGRTGTLFSRGATEITYLYGYKYGLGWPGNVSSLGGSGPGAGAVGFGVLANGFGAGIVYATPNLSGLQVSAGAYDANSLVGAGVWERVKWPRAEAEVTFERKFGASNMFKLFANGAWQKVYSKEKPLDATIIGGGAGGRLEIGPVHLGVAGHRGKGVGMDFALQPSNAGWDLRDPNDPKLRTFTGVYAQAMVSATQALDISIGAGQTSVSQNPEDKVDTKDDDMNPATPADKDAGAASGVDSVGFVTVKSQTGINANVTVHVNENVHLQFEYFRAMIAWYTPTPAGPNTIQPKQNFHVINAGITYAF